MKKTFLKYTAAVLSCALMLYGCGADGKKQTEEVASQEAESGQDESQGDAESAKATGNTAENTSDELPADGEGKEAAADQVPEISITQESREWYTDDGATKLLEAKASRVEVTSDGFDALKGALAAQWQGLDSGICDDALEMAKEHYSFDAGYFTAYSLDYGVSLYRHDSNVVSLCESWYEFSGGAHGGYGVIGKTFDVKSGRELKLEDILDNPDAFYDKAIAYILDELDKNYGEETFFPEYEETVRTQTFWGDYPASWYLDNFGIVIYYEIYKLAPYAAGDQTVTLPYDEFAEYMKEEYRIN